MKINYKSRIFIAAFFVILLGVFYANSIDEKDEAIKEEKVKAENFVIEAEKIATVDEENTGKIAEEKPVAFRPEGGESEADFIPLDVPFTPQAPFGEWKDPRQQDACEEASALMAVRWARGQKLNQEEAKREILAISKYQSENFGEWRDTSAEDTLKRIIMDYFKYDKAEVKKIINIDDIIKEIEAGRVVIIPANGQKLGNPYFTSPGPERHMVVIKGYDEQKKEFITNDPGTRRGEGYQYKEKVLFSAIRDYPTGYHAPIIKEEKVMIVIKK